MLFIHRTVSICNKCYRHIPGTVYEEDGLIKLTKKCTCDDTLMTSTVETDIEFYYSLKYHKLRTPASHLLFEVTDKCQLQCPHCYHLPDNKLEDRPIEDIVKQIRTFPPTLNFPTLAGAEPTLRKDLPEVCRAIVENGYDDVSILTNGIRFANRKFAQDCYDNGLKKIMMGLNHPSYQGMAIHEKQLRARETALDIGYDFIYTGYTLQSLDEVPFILDEISKFTDRHGGKPTFNNSTGEKPIKVRIRCGSFIGKSVDKERSYLSKLVKKFREVGGDDVHLSGYQGDDNPYHYMLFYKHVLVRLIQWPDVENIDMEELTTGPWCQFFDGPISNFVHQVIMRDGLKNIELPQLDYMPEYYTHYPVDKEYWSLRKERPFYFKEFDWSFESKDRKPTPKKNIP